MNGNSTDVSGRLRLAAGRDGRVRAGYLWIFADDIAEVMGTPEAGDVVEVIADSGALVGKGFFNGHSKIRVRLVTFRDEAVGNDFWDRRLTRALSLRERVVAGTTGYRLVHGEGDLLPGLIVDRYDDLLVMQTSAYGMDRRKDLLADLLLTRTGAKSVYLRNETRSRSLEGLALERGFLRGGGATTRGITEGRAQFVVDVEKGQKTGWFCDQRENRLAAAALAPRAEVLEAFCHTGAFGILAALHGAASVLGLDSSSDAVAQAGRQAALNGVEGLCRYREADAFEELPRLGRKGQRFDLVILDPPAFAKNKSAVRQALSGYREINRRAFELLRPDGFLVTCSCSHHVTEEDLWQAIREAARDARRRLRLIERRGQGRDHPILAAMPETGYLKCFILQAL